MAAPMQQVPIRMPRERRMICCCCCMLDNQSDLLEAMAEFD